MKVTVNPAYYPAYGVTLTPDYLHGLVDTASLTDFHVADFTDISLAGNPYIQPSQGEVYYQAASVVSLAPNLWSTLLQKSNLAYFHGSANYRPVKGLPAFVPDDGMNVQGTWSGWTACRISDWWYIPRISLTQRWPYDYFQNTSYQSRLGVASYLFGVVGASIDASEGIVPLTMYGMTQALIHATLSNELSLPGSVYEIYFEPTTRYIFPRAYNHTDFSAYTAVSWPMGICRKVYTASGVTLVNMRHENMTGVSMVPYYVADIFLGGFPCL